MKETSELMTFAAQTVNVGYSIASDGKVDLGDLAVIFPLVLAGQQGVGGVKEVGAEQAGINDREKAEIRKAMAEKLNTVPRDIQGDWLDAMIGILSIYRLGRAAAKSEATRGIIERIRKGERLEDIEKELTL